MVKNDISLGGCNETKCLFFFQKMCPKNTPMPQMSRIGPGNGVNKHNKHTKHPEKGNTGKG